MPWSDLREEFYVGIDADTVIAADAVSKLVCHFADPLIGAVAGNAKVGNRINLWTRWQALEYITSQNFERRALDLFDVVTVVPGAIGAWRTEAVRQGGCYPVNTVAEDADLTMNLLEQGYKVIYEDRALAFTEAPATARGLMRQRFRWSFGTLQAVYKHQAAFLKNRAMGLFALPNILVFQILLPLVSPFIDLMFVAGVVHYLLDRHFHPEAANASNFEKLLTFFLAFLIIDFVTSALAFSLERRHAANKGDGWLLFHIWLQRFAYRQLFSLVLFKTVKRAIDGRPFNWDKLERTAKCQRRRSASPPPDKDRSKIVFVMPTAQISTVIQPVAPQGLFRNEPFIDFSDSANVHAMQNRPTRVGDMLGHEYELIIGGEHRTAEKIESWNPARPAQVVGMHQKAGLEHAERAISSDRGNETWQHVAGDERAARCGKQRS